MATAKNRNARQSIAAPSGAVGEDVTHLTFWDHATNSADANYLQKVAVSGDPNALTLGATYEIAAQAIVFTQPQGSGERPAMAMKKLEGVVADGIWVQFHEGDPDDTGSSEPGNGMSHILDSFTDRVSIGAGATDWLIEA